MKTIIALFSGNGTNLQNIIHTYQNKYKIIAITNNKNANGIKICEKHNIKCIIIDEKSFKNRFFFNKELVKNLKSLEKDLIVLVGYMRIIPEFLLNEISTPIINLHPSLLPRHKGLQAIEKSFKDEHNNAGVSVHYVSKELDSGEIILQFSLNKKDFSDFSDFENKIKSLEYEIIPMAIDKIL
jgi:phosphoribosylglycinamide formyltransferase-1